MASLSQLTVVGNHFEDPSGNKVILRGVSIEGLYEQSQTGLGMNGIFEKITNKNDPASMSPGWYTRIVRLPVDPSGANSFQANPTNYVNTILKPAVDYATAAGLYAIVDLHYVDDPYTLVDAVNTFWTTVAPIFKDYTNVFYEVFNESNQTDTWADYKPTMQAWVNLIRSYAPNNVILAGSPAWDQTMGDTATESTDRKQHRLHGPYVRATLRDRVSPSAGGAGRGGQRRGHDGVGLLRVLSSARERDGPRRNLRNLDVDVARSHERRLDGLVRIDELASEHVRSRLDAPRRPSQMGGFVKDWMYTHDQYP